MTNPSPSPVYAGTPGFSDPAKIISPSNSAIGWPRRDAKLDALPGFKRPPAGYGEVAFYWWLGDPLTKRRIAWQIKQLSDKGVMGLQINYAHSDKGGFSWGLTYPSDPPLFSDAWWKLVQWFAAEARKHGMAVSLSDYTLNWPGQGWYLDEILKEDTTLHGSLLEHVVFNVPGGKDWVAEVHVNGKLAGVKVAPPWKIDISRYVRKGANRLEVLVYNTLANHYSTIPTNYRGSPVSGLLGPISVEFA